MLVGFGSNSFRGPAPSEVAQQSSASIRLAAPSRENWPLVLVQLRLGNGGQVPPHIYSIPPGGTTMARADPRRLRGGRPVAQSDLRPWLGQRVATVRALLTVGFGGLRCKEPTVNSPDQLTVATSSPAFLDPTGPCSLICKPAFARSGQARAKPWRGSSVVERGSHNP